MELKCKYGNGQRAAYLYRKWRSGIEPLKAVRLEGNKIKIQKSNGKEIAGKVSFASVRPL